MIFYFYFFSKFNKNVKWPIKRRYFEKYYNEIKFLHSFVALISKESARKARKNSLSRFQKNRKCVLKPRRIFKWGEYFMSFYLGCISPGPKTTNNSITPLAATSIFNGLRVCPKIGGHLSFWVELSRLF